MRPPSFLIATAFVPALSSLAGAQPQQPPRLSEITVGPQYSTTHIYLAPADIDRFVTSFLATFGGKSTRPVTATITPSPSSASVQLLQTPVGNLSVFGFHTPIPFPFGTERTGYLVRDLNNAVHHSATGGFAVLVPPFADPIGRDAIIQWPGGVNMQLYWHKTPPSYPPLQTVPENRIYLSPGSVTKFVDSFTRFSGGAVVSDNKHTPGGEIGRPDYAFERIRIDSGFGRIAIFVTDGNLPYPYGHETTGYAVSDLNATLAKAKAAGATILAGPYKTDDHHAAMVNFPGGYIAEIHEMK